MCGPQIRHCLFTFRPITSKQVNSLTTIDTLSWLGGAVVTHPLLVQDVTGSIPGSGKGLYVWLFCFVVVVCLLFSKSTIFVTNFCISFSNVHLFSILNILQDLWPIIRVLRCRPSIFIADDLRGNKKNNTLTFSIELLYMIMFVITYCKSRRVVLNFFVLTNNLLVTIT